MNNEETLDDVLDYLNDNYNQQSKNYDIFDGPNPKIIRHSKHVAVSLWACGAIVCIGNMLYFLSEDDGNWFVINDGEDRFGLQDPFWMGWIDSFSNALTKLKAYVEKNGTPVYYSGTKDICNYTL